VLRSTLATGGVSCEASEGDVMARLSKILTFSTFLVVPTAVLAQPRADDVETQHTLGNRLREQGRHAEARDLFRQLYAHTQDPRAIVRQGLAEMALSEWVAADEHLQTGLATHNNRWVEDNRVRIQGALRDVQSHVGSLVIDCAPVGAVVTVNQTAQGVCPLAHPLRMVVGDATVRVEAPGHVALQQTASVVTGDNPTTLHMTLVGSTTESPPVVVTNDAHVGNSRRRTMLTLGGVALGLGVAGVGAGLAGYLIEDAGKPLSPTLGVVGLAAGSALIITGIVLLVAAPARRPEPTISFGCMPNLLSNGIDCTMRF
jgi:hypothetical protein